MQVEPDPAMPRLATEEKVMARHEQHAATEAAVGCGGVEALDGEVRGK
jgi:hypothetical protein